ncbi:ABC transporter permease subunit, partial [Mycobacterium tuberculosis]|nr:ABC transporter permease subunit [Mycobacterium tuberculosis]
LYTRAAVQIGVVYNYLPLMIFPLYVAMAWAGLSLREASRDLGANRWTTFFRITLPLAAPGIASGVLLVFIPLMGDYVTPSVLGGAKGTMAGQMIAAQFETAQN